jgi:hypothetical protein
MSAIGTLSFKNPDGTYTNWDYSINDTTDKFGNNVSFWISQTKEEREAKAKKVYVANGRIRWTDGKIVKAEPIQKTETKPESDLPF